MTTSDEQSAQSLPRGIQRIWLVRHGQTTWNEQGRFCGHTDIPLSTLGRRQARKLASQLQHMPITAIYSSDLSRSKETGDIIAKKLSIDIILSPIWREVNFGTWEGLTYNEIASSFHDRLEFFTDPEHVAPPQGETLIEVLQRVIPALHEMVQREHHGEIVLVSHGGVLRCLLCSLLGMPLRNQWQLHIATGSLSAIDVSLDDHGELLASLIRLNSTYL